jgi:hypothetical protein
MKFDFLFNRIKTIIKGKQHTEIFILIIAIEQCFIIKKIISDLS